MANIAEPAATQGEPCGREPLLASQALTIPSRRLAGSMGFRCALRCRKPANAQLLGLALRAGLGNFAS